MPPTSDQPLRDSERVEQPSFERLQGELTQAFAAPDATYHPPTAAEVIARNQGKSVG